MEFVRHVLAAQADVLEVDVRTGKNRELIISHDKTEKETVRLAEVFESVKDVPYIRINCDLKETGIEENVFRLAKGVCSSCQADSFFRKRQQKRFRRK